MMNIISKEENLVLKILKDMSVPPPPQCSLSSVVPEIDTWIDGWTDGWMDGWMDRWMDELIDRWMDGCMDRQSDRHLCHYRDVRLHF